METVRVANMPLLPSLDHAAVEQDTRAVDLDEVTRAGDLARGAMKRDLHGVERTRTRVTSASKGPSVHR